MHTSRAGAEFFETHLDNQYACVENWNLDFPAKIRKFIPGYKIDTDDLRNCIDVTNMRDAKVGGAKVKIDQ